jgi:hypothetical protein
MPAVKSSIFSNILVLLGALAAAGGVFWFIYTSLGPVEVPPPPPERRPLKFDTKADVSQNPLFIQLHPLVNDFSVVPGNLGRLNPFMPVPRAEQALPEGSATDTVPGMPAMIPYEIPAPQTELPALPTAPETEPSPSETTSTQIEP